MMDSLLEKKLKNVMEGSILVVMDDGMSFIGTLKEFDKETIVLADVYQGSASEINWQEVSEETEADIKEKMDSREEKFGFVDWTAINLEEVYIRLQHVSRIWPWKLIKEKLPISKRYETGPVYRNDHSTPNISAGMDIPEGMRKR